MTDTKEDISRNLGEEYWENLDVNDCSYLLRTLEREAYTAVVNALRAKGPPSEHTIILLEHLRSALSINDELGRAEIRRATFDAKLCKISSVLNPNYDTCTEWSTCSMEFRGFVEAGPSRGKPFAKTSSTSIADQLLNLATTNNEKIDRSIGKSFELLCLPRKSYVPERLRLLLRETDRPEERIPHPLESIPSPVVPSTADRSTRSESRQVPIKKRRLRTSKGAKEKKLSELKAETSTLVEEGLSLHPHPSEIPSTSSASFPTPITPLAINALLNLSAVVGSAGSTILSPVQPPQSGHAMKTWVSKIHEQEVAASVASNGVMASPPEEIIIPSTSTPLPPIDDSAKKKRRPRSAQVQDPYYLNSCARTRPFQFERATNGKLKPPRGNPDISDSRSSGRHSPVLHGSSSARCVTPSVRPHDIDIKDRNGQHEVQSASSSTGTSPAGYGSGLSGNRPTHIQPTIIPYSSNSVLKRSHGSLTSSRPASKYYVNNSGVPVPASSSNTIRSPSNTVGIGGRTASLGSQQLSALHGIPFVGQRGSLASSMNSTGGSGIGASSSSSFHLNGESPSEDFGGHDYGFTLPSSSGSNSHLNSGGVRDSTGGTRITPRVVPRPRVVNAVNRNPINHTSPQNLLNGVPLSPSAISLHSSSTSSSHPLQRTGSMTSMRPRSGSRGAMGGVTGGVGDRIASNETVTDGIVQATVNTILLEAAQKECANGKRSTVPRELLERENGAMHCHSPVAGQSIQSPHSSSTIFRPPVTIPSDHNVISAGMSSSVNRPSSSIGHNSMDPPSSSSTVSSSFPSINTTVSPLHPSLSSSLAAATAAYNEFLKSGGAKLLGSTSSLPPSNLSPDPVPSLNKKMSPSPSIRSPIPPLCSEQIERILRLVHSGSQSSSTQPSPSQSVVSTANEHTQRQPEGMKYGDINLGNSRPFSSDGPPTQYTMTPNELYEQGLLARPSTSRGMEGIDPFPGTRSGVQDSQSSPHLFLNPSQQTAAIPAVHLASNQFSIPSTSSSGLSNNGEMSSSSRDASSSRHQPSPLQQILSRPVVIPPKEEKTPSEVKDILEQSCRELR